MVGFTSAADRNRLEAFLHWAVRLDYRNVSEQTFSDLCEQADGKLSYKITGNNRHLLYLLLSPVRSQHYSLQQRSHDFHIPTSTSALNDSNFLTRMLLLYCYLLSHILFAYNIKIDCNTSCCTLGTLCNSFRFIVFPFLYRWYRFVCHLTKPLLTYLLAYLHVGQFWSW